MTAAERITKIEAFVHLQNYLKGLQFRVLEEEGDAFVIEFAKASKRQIATLNHTLREAEMNHIRVRAMEVIEFEKPNFKKPRKNNGKKFRKDSVQGSDP